MTADPIRSTEEFNAELEKLLRQAYESGIDVEGGWECLDGSEHPDWDVIVAEVQKNASSTLTDSQEPSG